MLDQRNEVARGYLLVGVFYLHVLFAILKVVGDPAIVPAAAIQVKLLAGHVSIFFFLSGMGAPGLGRRSFESVAVQSLMLLTLATLSHVGGFVLTVLLYDAPDSAREWFRALVRPVLYGTGYSTFVAWFFVVLAAIRPLAWLFERRKIAFLAVAAILCLLVVVGQTLRVPGNLYEWRNWPFAWFFFLIGMHVKRGWRISAWLGLMALPVSLAAAWFNRPDLLADGLCWSCAVTFLPFPMVGLAGYLPFSLIQEAAFLIFLLWASQLRFIPQVPRTMAWFGRVSMQMLLLHGWVLAALFPLLARIMPFPGGAWPYLLALVVSPIVHAGVYWVLRPLLDCTLALCFTFSRRLAQAAALPWSWTTARRAAP